MQQNLIRLAFAFQLLLAAGPAFAQVGGAGPVGHPQGGGKLPSDMDTLTVGIVAATTHTQAAAIANALCQTTICEVDTGNANDGVALRQCTQAPLRQEVINNTGNALQVFGSGTDTLDNQTATVGVSIPVKTSTYKTGATEFICTKGGAGATWFSQ